MQYIAFLRGINVGGHTVKMEFLRSLFSKLGLSKVRSYINSGNIFFESEETEQIILTEKIESQLQIALGYQVPTFLRTTTELEHILSLDPFKGTECTEDMRLCVMFVQTPIPQNLVLPLHSPKRDATIVKVTTYEAFVVWQIINGRPPTAGFLDKVLGKQVTTRFFHTAIKILAAATSA